MDGGDEIQLSVSCLLKIPWCGMMCVRILASFAMEQRNEEGKENEAMDGSADHSIYETLHARPRSNTCPIIQSSTNSRKLKFGSKVIILGTDNVEQRVPQYVGAEAIIVDVPGNCELFIFLFSSFF
jgi:hypothetical protein